MSLSLFYDVGGGSSVVAGEWKKLLKFKFAARREKERERRESRAAAITHYIGSVLCSGGAVCAEFGCVWLRGFCFFRYCFRFRAGVVVAASASSRT